MILTPASRLAALLAAASCTALLGMPAFAEPAPPGTCMPPRAISVTGHGESQVAPDQMLISLGVTTQADTAAKAMADNTAQQLSVVNLLKDSGVSETDIQTSGLTLNPMMTYPENAAPKINGYMAQNLLTVRITDIAGAGQVLDGIVSAGANEMQGIRFVREDSQAAEDEALRRAVADARHRAGVMAEAAGVELGPILRMGDPQTDMSGPQPVMMRAMDSGAAKSVPIESGEISLTADIEISFALGDGACALPGTPPAAGETGGDAAPAN
ncbi:MAG: SIMPL domain-containing protein [Paracoccus sp. (in: a-proteobacteria)]